MAGGGTGSTTATAPVFGREDVVGEILRVLDKAREGAGQGLLLVGPQGIGKSHLLRVAVDGGRERGYRVIVGRALPDDLPAPLTLLREMLASERSGPGEPADVALHESEVPLYLVPFLGTDNAAPHVTPETPTGGRRTVEEVDGILFPVGTSAVEAVGLGRQELIGRAADYFRDAARAHPLLLVIDDLQFADGSSLDVLRRLATELRTAPLAVIASLGEGPSFPDRSRPAIDELRRATAFHTVALRPFGPLEVAEFVRWIQGGHSAPEPDVLRWHAQTDGNPLFVEQIVRSRTGYSGDARDEPVGKDVTELLRARYASMAGPERRLLAYAAVLGKEFSFADLAAITGSSEERTTEELDRLVHGGLLRGRGGEVYEFVSEAVRAGVYSELTETRRRILHQKAGRALERLGEASDSELARQFYLGRDDAKAAEYNTRAAQAATRAFALDTAVSHLGRALEAERRRPDRSRRSEIRLLTELGRLLDEIGRFHRADEIYTEAVNQARDQAGMELELGRAMLGLAQTRSDKSEYASAAGLATEATEILDRVGTTRDLILAHRVLGTVSWRLGRPAEAEAHQRSALEIAEREGTRAEVGHALIDLANTLVPEGAERIDTALALYGQAAEIFAAEDDQGARARVLMNRAMLRYTAGHIDEALVDLQAAVTSAERSHSPVWIGYCYLNLAQIEAEQGRPVSARRALDRCVESVNPLGDRLASQQVAMARGMVAEAEGALDAAEIHYVEALEQAKQLGTTAEVAESLFHLAHVAHGQGDTPGTRERLAEAWSSGGLAHRPDLVARVKLLEEALGEPSHPHA
ncbi:MAG: tetratricopeptide repeat protein [Thermoplasmata archaeon]|nr:tetratricopeptide repeat protein [Thermoplasmata archaeon]